MGVGKGVLNMEHIEEFRKLVWEYDYLIISHKWDLHIVYCVDPFSNLDDFVKFMDRNFVGEFDSLERLVAFMEREIEQDYKTDELVKWIEKYRAKGLITDEGAVQTND